MTEIVKPSQGARDAAADLLFELGHDWGFCGDIREGRVAHVAADHFARFEQSLTLDREGIAQALFNRQCPNDDWGIAKQHSPHSDAGALVTDCYADADAILSSTNREMGK